MPDSPNPDFESPEEIKSKLRQIRAAYTRAQNILKELDEYFETFVKLRDELDDEGDGLKANLDWSQNKRNEVAQLVEDTEAKAAALESSLATVKGLVDSVQTQHGTFTSLAAKINDPSTGIEAVFTHASNLRQKVANLLEEARVDAGSAKDVLAAMLVKQDEVQAAYEAFLDLQKEVNDTETGVAAQLAEIKQYAKDALKAKTAAETDLLAIVTLKDNATKHLEEMKLSVEEIETLKQESGSLTEDIKNIQGVTSAYSLSAAIEAQRKRLDGSVRWWGAAVAVTLLLLCLALGAIYYTLFYDGDWRGSLDAVKSTNIFLTVLSKALFTSPLIFALYFTTTNYSRTRDFRDRYLAKEIAAKNLQAYVKQLHDQFEENKDERLQFALHNMQAIYDDPVMDRKKKSYNFGLNKVIQLSRPQDVAKAVQDVFLKSAEDVVKKKNPK